MPASEPRTSRPELRQAVLREQQADYERRIAKADYIPDVSLSVRYMGFYNYEVLPSNVAVAGVFVSWEPFDWKRRSNKVAERTKAVEQARSGAQQARSQVAIEVGAKYRSWSEAALLVPAARTGYEAATEQLRVTTNRYKDEAALLKDLLQAAGPEQRDAVPVPAGTVFLLGGHGGAAPGDGR